MTLVEFIEITPGGLLWTCNGELSDAESLYNYVGNQDKESNDGHDPEKIDIRLH